MQISNQESLKILIVSAEDSSAMYATSLLKHWRARGVSVDAFGVGSESMADLGFRIIGRSEDLAVMGLQEIISHWSVIKSAFHGLVDAAEKERPDLVLLMDYPEFNLRLAKKMKQLGIPVVYYISPQIWAWRTYRVHKIKKIIDLMLVLFPFEQKFYSKYAVSSEFVGHPLVDYLDDLVPPMGIIQKKREELLPSGKTHILGLMPGSRNSEVEYNLETQLITAQKVMAENSNVQPILFVAPSLDKEKLLKLCQEYGVVLPIIKEDPFHMISYADTILCASGTATLMVGLCEKPMVIMYKMNRVTAFFARRLVTHVSFFGMVNLVSEKEVVPERFQSQANPEELSSLLGGIIKNKDGARDKILTELAQLRKKLGKSGGIASLAHSIESFVKRRKSC